MSTPAPTTDPVTPDPVPAGEAPGGDAPDAVGLSFVDLLYAVPIADLATRLSETHLHHVQPSGWADVAVALVAITFGWIGHHANYQQMPEAMKAARRRSRRKFTEPRFAQFLVEILVILAYFALGTRALLPAGAGVGSASEVWKAECLTALFGLYCVWDALAILIAKQASQADWQARAKRALQVSACFAAVFATVLLVVSGRPRPDSVVVFDLFVIVLLYAYRVTLERWTGRATTRR